MLQGPWPAIVTTNWDSLFEAAWPLLSAEHRQHRGELRRFYRRNAGDFLAHLKVGVRPLLFKSHGDFEEGKDEFVFTHRQYRSLTLNERGTQNLLNLLCCEYSFLFYGHSLTDPDLLGLLDASHDALGSAIGPHYWVAPTKEVPEPLRRFLRQHHNVEVIDIDDATEYEGWLDAVVTEGWQRADAGGRAQIVPSLRYALGDCVVELTPDPLPAVDALAEGEAVALSVAWSRRGKLSMGRSAGQWLGAERAARLRSSVSMESDEQGFQVLAEDPPRARVWLVSGQTVGGYGRTDFVRGVVQRFLPAARDRGIDHIHLSVIAAGGGGLPSNESLAAMLHGIGGVAPGAAPRRITLHVALHVESEVSEFSLITDILDGLLDADEILRRGRSQRVALTVIHPRPDGSKGTLCSRVFLAAEAKGADLLAALSLCARCRWEVTLRRPMEVAPRQHDHLLVTERSLSSQQMTDSVLVELKSAATPQGDRQHGQGLAAGRGAITRHTVPRATSPARRRGRAWRRVTAPLRPRPG